jgi:hypothetical protein
MGLSKKICEGTHTFFLDVQSSYNQIFTHTHLQGLYAFDLPDFNYIFRSFAALLTNPFGWLLTIALYP